MRKTILILASLLVVFLSHAQAPQFQWAKGIGGTSFDTGLSLTTDASGNVYNTGYFEGTVDFDPGTNVFNLTSSGTSVNGFISKYDAAGNFIWAKQISADCSPNSITIDGVGDIYTTGYFSSIGDFDPGVSSYSLSTNGDEDVFVLKLDALGNFVWAKSIGGVQGDFAYEVKTDVFNNVFVTGYFSNAVDFNPGAGVYNLNSLGLSDIFILKLDGAGNYLWAENFGSSSFDYSNSIALDNSGNIYISGVFTGTVDFDSSIGTYNLTSFGSEDAFLLKLDMNGNFVWANNVGGNAADGIVSVKIDLSGNIYCTGYFYGAVDFDPGSSIYTLTSSLGYSDSFILKLDNFGNFIWAKRFGESGYNTAFSSSIDAFGNIYTTGYFETIVNFDPDGSDLSLTSNGGYDAFILKLDINGNFIWVKRIGENFDDVGASISVSSFNDIYITGIFGNSVSFDSYTLISNGQSDIFITKISDQTVSVNESVGEKSIEVYPNPSNGKFHIESSKLIANKRIEIYNSLGVLIREEAIDQDVFPVDLSIYPKGLCFLRLLSKDEIITIKKIVIQ